ncbi:hypothetical protein [Actinoplanes sp. NPDC020271]|uniref:hypothetical protein n=1 Tax=Actinoplanes sp. NPDC020271 TaxID=3363896 RepID=UPI0037A7A35E
MTALAENDLQARRTRIRERELLLALERWAPAYRDVAGDTLTYVFEIAEATEPERDWLRQRVAEKGLPVTPGPSHEQVRAAGYQANAAASAAFLAGDYEQARDRIDDARVYGALFEIEWVKLHRFISARAGYAPVMTENEELPELTKRPDIPRPVDLQDAPRPEKPGPVAVEPEEQPED